MGAVPGSDAVVTDQGGAGLIECVSVGEVVRAAGQQEVGAVDDAGGFFDAETGDAVVVVSAV